MRVGLIVSSFQGRVVIGAQCPAVAFTGRTGVGPAGASAGTLRSVMGGSGGVRTPPFAAVFCPGLDAAQHLRAHQAADQGGRLDDQRCPPAGVEVSLADHQPGRPVRLAESARKPR